VQIDEWDWSGDCDVIGQTLQFSVSGGTHSRAFPTWVSGDCNPSLNESDPLPSGLIVFTSWEVVGNTLNVAPPTDWNLPTNVALFYSAQDSAGIATWSYPPWVTLDGYCNYGVAVSSWGPGRLDVFVIGQDGATWHRAWSETAWADWKSLSGGCICAPAAVSWGPNRIDAFVISGDHALYHKWWDGSTWSGWENLEGYCLYGCAAVSQGPNLLDVFVTGGDGAIWHRAFNGSTWGQWDNTAAGFSISAPAASCPSGSNEIDLYCIGLDHAVWHNPWRNGAWLGWFSLGGDAVYGVAATTSPDVWTTGLDGAMYRNAWTGSNWTGWVNFGGACISGPGAVSWGPGHIDVCVIGQDHACWHKWYG
jgi:hypothetical protein